MIAYTLLVNILSIKSDRNCNWRKISLVKIKNVTDKISWIPNNWLTNLIYFKIVNFCDFYICDALHGFVSFMQFKKREK